MDNEKNRHEKVMTLINNAKKIDELPNISISNISSYLSRIIKIDGKCLSQKIYKPVVDEIINTANVWDIRVKIALKKVLKDSINYENDEYIDYLFKELISASKINNIIIEVSEKNKKIEEFNKIENKEKHLEVLKNISYAYKIKDLPKVGISDLNKRLIKDVNDNDLIKNIKISEIKSLTDLYMSGVNYAGIKNSVINIVKSRGLSIDQERIVIEQIISNLIKDEVLLYIVQEINIKEDRKLKIYQMDHDDIMEEIKAADRIYRLPDNVNISTLNSYLLGNSTIYTNDNRLKSEDLKSLTMFLLETRDINSEKARNEIMNITKKFYSEKADAYSLLFNKFKNLPRLNYLIEEINYSMERQKEFIINRDSNVNVYLIPNDKCPFEGGRFYNVYINRVHNLDLDKILPLNINELVPKKLDIDSIEWYVKEYIDDTFKLVGGIILNKDETIGNINIYKPNDGKVGVSLEE